MSNDKLTELKPCPFCGEHGEVETDHPFVYVRCDSCEAAGPVGLLGDEDSFERSIASWNRRTPAETVSLEAIAELVGRSGDDNWTDGQLTDAIYALQLPAPQPGAHSVAELMRQVDNRICAEADVSRPPVPSVVGVADIEDLARICMENYGTEPDNWSLSSELEECAYGTAKDIQSYLLTRQQGGK